MSVWLIGAFLAILPAGAVRSDGRSQGQGRAPDLFDDPFGDLLPPANTNPNTRNVRDPNNQIRQNEERLLASETLLDEQVELREEERMEVLCAAYGLRESTEYNNEQANEAQEELDVRTWTPTDAEHQCLPIAKQNKFMPGELIGLSGKIPVPVFPQRLGEIVIEAVTHSDVFGKHIVLEVSGCSSCENDATSTVEWAGLLPLDETGKPTGMKAGASGLAQTKLVQGFQAGSGYPRVFSFDKCPARLQKYVQRYNYKYSSYQFDSVVEPKARELVSSIGDDMLAPSFLTEHRAESVQLMEDLKKQVKHIPFNHKLEQLHMNVKVCNLVDNHLDCPRFPQESLILHDGGLVVSSAETLLFDEIGKNSAEQCSYGPCIASNGRPHYMVKGNDKYDFTMCSQCGDKQCPATRTNPKPKTKSSDALPSENWFNCLVERFHTGAGYIDMFQQSHNDKLSTKSVPGNGFLYRGTDSPGHVEGHINWHISIPPKRHCEPVLQDAVYVGMGVDEADRCAEMGGVDVDIGVILISCEQDPLHGKLGAAKKGGCEYYDHLNYAKKKAKSGRKFYAISGDNRGGEGEGDDEWIFLDLAGLRANGVTHAVLMANIFGCAQGRPDPALKWSELEGAFMRVTASGKSQKQFTAAETISYVDLDEMKGGADAGAAVYVLYLSEESKLAVPFFVKDHVNRKDDAANDDKSWKLLSLKQPLPGTVLGQSAEHVAALLYGKIIETIPERGIAAQTVNMGLADTLATGQQVRTVGSNSDILTADWTSDLEDLSNEAISADLNHPQPGENAHEKKARTMSEANFKKHFSEYLPEGAPGTDSYCI